ncbi:O-fucosyltransferase 36 isoform X1 [Cajanus cajan]|uniref:O-fucosyltransferase family protein n=1 Tax=Cajanus cajan TaxID=3821 RepID=A0A151TYA7_CAJCA|nr:O-fucosyltransferase 36 isoform X1 [Cajanus cajan]KYP72020.1 hypothetical protein KK1_011307 [Cajanus cajan]
MERGSSSDEEDELIHENERNAPASTSSFHLTSKFHKKYLFAILPLFIILLYYITPDTHSLFSLNTNNVHDRTTGSQLRALYLLRQQQLGLLRALNSTSQTHILKSLLSDQIFLNSQIQQLFLHSGNATCRAVDQKVSQRRSIEWKPKGDKYLVAVCVSGQMSKRLICLEKHMLFAALLNRVLVIPSSKLDYEYDRVLDIDHINNCLGTNVKAVISFHEFSIMKKKHVHVHVHVLLLCYFSLPEPCHLDEEHLRKLKSLGLSMSRPTGVWEEDARKPNKRSAQDVVKMFWRDEDVVAIGDVFYAEVEPDWVMQPGGPLAHHCKTLIEPRRLILLTAQRFIQTFLGRNFVALHFRRHDFLNFCNAKKPSCFYPIPQAAECILRVVERANAPLIYLSTDAAETEIGLLQSLLVLDGRPVPLVKRPPRNSAEKWDAFLYRHHMEGDPQVEAMLDRSICAMSSVFIGASGSSFTRDIRRLRKDWGSASLCDEYLCQGEEPNFVADSE